MNAYEFIKKITELTKQYEWLKEVDSCLLRTSIFDLDNAYQKYFKKCGEEARFKSKNKNRNNYRTNNIMNKYKNTTYESIKLDLEKRTITLPKIKEIEIRGY